MKDGTFELDEPIEDWTRIRINDDESQPMRWYKIVGLNSNSYYEIEIIATNDRGSSSPNNEFIFVTHKGQSSLIHFHFTNPLYPIVCACKYTLNLRSQ